MGTRTDTLNNDVLSNLTEAASVQEQNKESIVIYSFYAKFCAVDLDLDLDWVVQKQRTNLTKQIITGRYFLLFQKGNNHS